MNYFVIDFEFTFYKRPVGRPRGFFNEIIEAGAVLLDSGGTETGRMHAFVKPHFYPKQAKDAYDFCMITEKEMKKAIEFPEMVRQISALYTPGNVISLHGATKISESWILAASVTALRTPCARRTALIWRWPTDSGKMTVSPQALKQPRKRWRPIRKDSGILRMTMHLTPAGFSSKCWKRAGAWKISWQPRR